MSRDSSVRRYLARGVRRLRHGRPGLSVVVLAGGGDPAGLRATLDSVRDQPSPSIELVVVCYDDGEPLARAAAGEDTRARFLRAADLLGAVRRGTRAARGTHVLVAAPGDLYPTAALAGLVAALEPGETLLLAETSGDPEPADLLTRPEIARRPFLGRLVVPRARLAQLLENPPVLDDADGMRLALVVLEAGVTLTPYRAYADGRFAERGPFQVRHDPLPGLDAHVRRDRDTLASLAGHPPAREQRAVGALTSLRPFLAVAQTATAEQRDLLGTHAGALLELASAHLDEVDVLTRALAGHAAAGRYDALVALVASRAFTDGFATRVSDGVAYADLPGEPDDRVLGEPETPLLARLRRLRVDGGELVLEVLAGVRLVDTVAPRVEARLVDGERSVAARVEIGSDAAVTRWLAEPEQDHDGGLVTLRVAADALGPGGWRIDLDWADRGVRRSGSVDTLSPSGSAGRGPVPLAAGTSIEARARFGRLALVVAAGEAPATDVTLRKVESVDGALRLTTAGTVTGVRLEGNGHQVTGLPGGAPGFWTVPLVDDRWGLGEGPLPSGGYRLVLEAAAGALPVTADPALVDQLPVVHRSALHRVKVALRGRSGVEVRLEPLLTDDELGRRAQRRLQVEHAAERPLDPRLVYFQSFTGQWGCDNPLAIQAELHRRRPDLDVRWVVADSSATVPVGAAPVLFRSRDWYDVMSRASFLVTNIELEKWFTRRPGQQVLQTFHGYPSKAMGLGLWKPRGLTPAQIEAQLDHTSRVWNNLVTPSPEMDRYYRRDYAYDGPILALGYPRNDALVGPAATELRDATRARLGIAPGQHAILYAPTWRDDLATGFRAAEAVHHLDVDRAAAALGEDYVLLLRGHRFHAAAGRTAARVLDVTAYPDVNHLIAASDAAVLDYSSLRFDFAITGRPMVFLVPDLDTYGSSTRGFLWDYRETAPGPLVATTAEVVRELRDLDGLSARTAGDLASFNTRYNALHDGGAAERVVAAFFAPLLRS